MASLAFSKVYSSNSEVKNLNLEIDDKEFFILLGSIDSGKSTVLRMIAGLEEIAEGELCIADKSVKDVEPKDRDIAMVFKSYALYPHMSVYENMAFGLKLKNISKEEIDKKILDVAKYLDLTNILDKKPKTLSAEEKHRVAIGRAIVKDPKVLLIEESLYNIEDRLKPKMRAEIIKLHKKLQTTFIFATGNQMEAMTMGTKIAVMKDGIVQQIDTPKNIYDYPANIFVAGLVGIPEMNFVDAKLAVKNERILVVFGEEVVILPEDKSKILKEKGYVGKEVVFGIRSENIKDDEEFVSKHEDGVVKFNVNMTEMMGSETYVHLSKGKSNLIAKVNGFTAMKSGDKVTVALDENKIHIFDKETGVSIV